MLKQFFWMCSGADTDILENSSKAEQTKFAGIGGTVFFTAVMAFIAASYALYTVFDSYFTAIIFGLIWGLLIFNLDRFIVSTIKKHKVDQAVKVGGTTYAALFGLMTGTYAFIKLNDLNESKDIHFYANPSWENQLCWDVPEDTFKNWYA